MATKTSGGYGAVDTGGIDLSKAAGLISALTSASGGADQANKAMEYTRAEINSIVKYAEEGDWTWKLLGMFGGLGMMATGSLSFLGHFFLFNYFGAILDVYIVLFGILSIILEYKESILPARWVDNLKVEAKFMYKPYGRAVLYIFFGVLLVSQGAFLYTLLGVYLCGIGALVLYYATQAQKALDAFKAKKLSSWQLKSEYDKVDKNHNGLTPGELAKIITKFGCSMSENEVAAAIGLLDKDSSGRVTYDEFQKWYNAR